MASDDVNLLTDYLKYNIELIGSILGLWRQAQKK